MMPVGRSVVDGIVQRSAVRGLERKPLRPPLRIGVDEISFQKRDE